MKGNGEMYYLDDIVNNKNQITINQIRHPICVSQFLKILNQGVRSGYKNFSIQFATSKAVYPNACVPLAGIIDFYKSQGITFDLNIPRGHYLDRCYFGNAVERISGDTSEEMQPFDKIYKYNSSDQVAILTQSYINAISKIEQCEKGVLEGLIWCLSEVMDNVLTHSNSPFGYVMVQYHSTTKHIAICIYDFGQGIYNSLKDTKHAPKTTIDAISLSLNEGVGDGMGQGNGLYGLYGIIQNSNGSLNITSGSAAIMIDCNGNMKKFEHIPFLSLSNNATTIDFQIDLSKKIDIQRAFSNIGGFDGFDIRIDDMLTENGMARYEIYKNCSGTGTRQAGLQLRNDVVNTLNRSQCPIILDFEQIEAVSSSFIDEFIAKLFLQFGLTRFNQYFRLVNMKENVRFLCERSTYMRIHHTWENERDTKEIS